jgi:hypothetical protein
MALLATLASLRKHLYFRDGIETRGRLRVIRMCDGKNRLKAEAGMVPFPVGKGERGRKPSQFSSLGKIGVFLKSPF